MTYIEAMEYIEYTNTLGSVPGLDSIKELLRRLGDPQDDVDVIHIAGTNGKGSICAFLDEILEDSGYSVGRYISPTIFTYLERFQIDKRYMTGDEFAGYIDIVKRAADDMVREGYNRPTSFETETAVAFCYFRDKKVDVLLLETGMGGLLDATNVCRHPLCTVIASISMDHMRFLGDTLGDIYSHKLGILRDGVPCVSYPVDARLMPMWVKACRDHDIADEAVMLSEDDIRVLESTENGSRYEYSGREYSLDIPGIYQIYNSAVAVETAHTMCRLGYHIEEKNIRDGLHHTYWKGRFQRLMESPLVYVDGAHNPGGWKSLRKNIDTYFSGRRLIYVCGVFKDKDYRQMLDIMMPGAVCFIAVEPDNPRALPCAALADLARGYIEQVYEEMDADKAVQMAIERAAAEEDPVVIIFGSLSFIGPVIDKAEHGGYGEDRHGQNRQNNTQ